MLQIVTPAGQFGPYANVQTLADRYRADGAELPFSVVGQGEVSEWVGDLPVPPVPPLDRAALVREIDDAAAQVYARVGRFEAEYREREAQAQAFKDGGYLGDVPPRVAEFAGPAGLTAHAAASLILSQAAALRAALGKLSAQRMRKYLVSRAATDAEAAAVAADVLGQIKQIAGALT